MVRLYCVTLALGLLVGACGREVRAQDSTAKPPDTTEAWYEDAWTPIVTRNGLHIDYLFYREADSENNGVVLRLRNRNEYSVRYEFTVIFRSPRGRVTTSKAEGSLAAGRMKTGENPGLFWIPFRDGTRVAEVGLRGIEVRRTPQNASDRGFPN